MEAQKWLSVWAAYSPSVPLLPAGDQQTAYTSSACPDQCQWNRPIVAFVDVASCAFDPVNQQDSVHHQIRQVCHQVALEVLQDPVKKKSTKIKP